GAKAKSLFTLILIEGLLMIGIGIILGLVGSRVGLIVLSTGLENQFHFDIFEGGLLIDELWLILITIFVGILASLLPAIEAVTINISKTLSDA
ncbi:MAG: permease, partial [Flavobacteriales bacterium]